MAIQTRQQLSMSFRLQRQRGMRARSVSRWLIVFLGVGTLSLLVLRNPHWMSTVSEDIAQVEEPLSHSLPRESPLLLAREAAPIPSVAASLLLNTEPEASLPPEDSLQAPRVQASLPRKRTMRRKPLHRYTFVFQGHAVSNEIACAHAHIRVALSAGKENLNVRGVTDENGFYSIPAIVRAAPGSPIDWVLFASKPEFQALELIGRKIAIDETTPSTIEHPLVLVRG